MSNMRKASCSIITLKMITNDSDFLCSVVLSQLPLPYPPHIPEPNSVYPHHHYQRLAESPNCSQ